MKQDYNNIPKTSSTRQTLLSSLQSLRYNTLEFLLTPLQFAIPNSRLRYYMLAKLEPLTFADIPLEDSTPPKRSIPGCGMNWIDPRHCSSSSSPEYQCYELSRFLDSSDKAQDSSYWQEFAVPDKTLQKKGALFDIVLPHSRRTCCFTRGARLSSIQRNKKRLIRDSARLYPYGRRHEYSTDERGSRCACLGIYGARIANNHIV